MPCFHKAFKEAISCNFMGELEDLVKKYAGHGYSDKIVSIKEITPSNPIFKRSIAFLTMKDKESGEAYLLLSILGISEKGYALNSFPASKQNSEYQAEKIRPLYDSISTDEDFIKIKGSKVDFDLSS